MRKPQVWIAFSCLLILAAGATAQSTRKPGLWEVTSTMSWQQSPMPQGMTMPGGGPHTTQVCITQAIIDKYGAPTPQSHNNQCQISNPKMKPNGMTADWVCTGPMAGKGTVESSWTDAEHATSKVHFLGNMQMGPNSKTIEYTIESNSVYKGADCGSVKPIELPSN
jgi:hypothetical protein